MLQSAEYKRMKDYKRVLTVQDLSCVGQCSLTVALPILSHWGLEACALPTAILSTHTGGFDGYSLLDLTEEMPRIFRNWEKNGIRFDAIYTGYLHGKKQTELLLGALDRFLPPAGKLIVDPVMGDDGRLYDGFDDGFVQGMRALCARADVILPNLTEAAYLTGLSYQPEADTLGALERPPAIAKAVRVSQGQTVLREKTGKTALPDKNVRQDNKKTSPIRETDVENGSFLETMMDALTALCPGSILLTGLEKGESTGVAILHGKERNFYYHPRYARNYPGTGDVFAATFVGAYTAGHEIRDAARIAANFAAAAIRETMPDTAHWYGVEFEKLLHVEGEGVSSAQ